MPGARPTRSRCWRMITRQSAPGSGTDFGLTVIDAIRAITPARALVPVGYEVRRADPADGKALSELEAEHWRHYTLPPVFMADRDCKDAAGFAAFMDENSVWIAEEDGTALAYMQFEEPDSGSDC